MRFLSVLINIYMMIIFARIILTWFSWEIGGKFYKLLASITDPYLNWFRRFSFLRAGFIDFSPIAALGVLSLVNRIFGILASYGTITAGIILTLILQLVWGVISFVIGFLIIILVLRLIALFMAADSAAAFWRIIDGISKPVLYRVNRLLFKNRIVNFRTGLLITIVIFVVIYIIMKTLVTLVTGLLLKLPV